MTNEERGRVAGRAGVQATGVVATTGLAVWSLDAVLPGPLPGEVHFFVTWAVPAACGLLTAWWARRHPPRPSLPQ